MKTVTFNDSLRHCIQQRLEAFSPRSHAEQTKKHAAVAITIVELQTAPTVYDISFDPSWVGETAVVLTKRAAKLKKHAGQWALPGGRIDEGETPEETALRELAEEVDLHLTADHIIGRLDDYSTRSGFTITPIVVWGGTDCQMVPNPGEVAAIHRIPARELLRKDAPILHDIPESEHPVLLMPIGNNWIAAPTGAILYQFREVALLNKATRVAHFEQPYFAWK